MNHCNININREYMCCSLLQFRLWMQFFCKYVHCICKQCKLLKDNWYLLKDNWIRLITDIPRSCYTISSFLMIDAGYDAHLINEVSHWCGLYLTWSKKMEKQLQQVHDILSVWMHSFLKSLNENYPFLEIYSTVTIT